MVAHTHTLASSVILGLKENMHGCCLLSGCWFGGGHSALIGTESCRSCLAWPKPGCLLKKPGSAREAGYQLNVTPSVLGMCQGKRDVMLEHVWSAAKSPSSVCAFSWIGVPVFGQLDFSDSWPQRALLTYFTYFHLLCKSCSLWSNIVLTNSYVVLSVSPLGHIFINL